MKNKTDWKLISMLEVAFWSGIIIISIINIILNIKQNNVLLYDFYISGVSIIAISIFMVILIKKRKIKR